MEKMEGKIVFVDSIACGLSLGLHSIVVFDSSFIWCVVQINLANVFTPSVIALWTSSWELPFLACDALLQ
jgi:hypothetical protein